jgi:squalene monooxygenase
VGLVLDDVELPMPNRGTVCLTPEGPVLLYQIAKEAKETRMLVDVKGELPSIGTGAMKVGDSWLVCAQSRACPCHAYTKPSWQSQHHIIEKYLPHLPSSTHPSILAALDTKPLRKMPNSFLPPSPS